MNSINDLLNMICTEAHEGPSEGCADYGRQLPSHEAPYTTPRKIDESSFQYNLELIRNLDGTYEWVE